MNKKLVMIGAGVVAGSVLLMSSVYAGIGSTPGYDAYKAAIKNTAAVDNVTEKLKLSVEDNGKVLFQVDATIKTGKADQTNSAYFTLLSGTTKQTIQTYSQEGKNIIKTSGSDVYQIIEKNEGEREYHHKFRGSKEQHDPVMAKELENIVDALVGNLKNNVTLNEEGTTKEMGIELKGSQIPAIVNTIGSIVIRESGRNHGEELELNSADTMGVDVQSIIDNLPKLVEDIKIDTLELNADVNADNLITSHDAEIQISGKDSEGSSHNISVKLIADSSDFNNTTPDTIDLTDKKVEAVNLEGKSHHFNK